MPQYMFKTKKHIEEKKIICNGRNPPKNKDQIQYDTNYLRHLVKLCVEQNKGFQKLDGSLLLRWPLKLYFPASTRVQDTIPVRSKFPCKWC